MFILKHCILNTNSTCVILCENDNTQMSDCGGLKLCKAMDLLLLRLRSNLKININKLRSFVLRNSNVKNNLTGKARASNILFVVCYNILLN